MAAKYTRRFFYVRNYPFMIALALVVGVNSFCRSHAQADEGEGQNVSTESVLTPDQAKQKLQDLSKQVEAAEGDIQKLREQFGPNNPTVIQAEAELRRNREILPLYRKLLPLLAGERDAKKAAETSLSKQLAAKMAHQEMEAEQRRRAESEETAPAMADIQRKFDAMAQALQAREQALVEAKMQLAKFERDRLPQIESGDLKIYTLQALPAKDAALSIETLFGAKSIRVAVDNRTNSLIVYGDREALPTIEALLQRLDETASSEKRGGRAAAASPPLVLRVFWLADAGTDRSQVATDILPESVIKAATKLGVDTPYLVTQTLTTLNVTGSDGVEFQTSVPALLYGRVLQLRLGGKLTLVQPDRAAVAMHADVVGEGINCELRGSIAMPLGHYMILGTSNSVLPHAANAAPDAAGMEGGFGAVDPASGLPLEPKFNSTRFAFVVQVIPAESFAPGE
jgi:hypothetical protein